MTTIPLRDVGIAAYHEGDSFTSVELFNATVPPPVTEDFLVAQNSNIPRYSVVGLLAGALALATFGDVAPVAATGVLTFSGVGTADDTITIGARVYTLKAAPAAANQVKIGATAAETATNLIAAINGDAGAGALYGAGTAPHADVSARSNASAVVGLVAKAPGTAGNAIATTESGTGTSFGAATMTGGLAEAGVDPIGVTAVPVVTGAGETDRIPIYRQGNFNPAALNWHPSYDTDDKKAAAFRGSPTPTNIIIRKRL
jgi:hypothetical protein